MSIRDSIVAEIQLLAHPSKQLQYESDVPHANIPAELVCGFCDDLYHPGSQQMQSLFTEEELKDLAHLYGILVEAAKVEVGSASELLKNEKWRSVTRVAKQLDAYYSRQK